MSATRVCVVVDIVRRSLGLAARRVLNFDNNLMALLILAFLEDPSGSTIPASVLRSFREKPGAPGAPSLWLGAGAAGGGGLGRTAPHPDVGHLLSASSGQMGKFQSLGSMGTGTGTTSGTDTGRQRQIDAGRTRGTATMAMYGQL